MEAYKLQSPSDTIRNRIAMRMGLSWNRGHSCTRIARRACVLALAISIVSTAQGVLFAQSNPSDSSAGNSKASQSLSPEELRQLVAPIALDPDTLVTQILAASTDPEEIIQAQRWLHTHGHLPDAQLAAAVDTQKWPPGIKALAVFPSVMDQMGRNMHWTTALGNAYYNQPYQLMDALQVLRERAKQAGTLHDTPQQKLAKMDTNIVIEPTDPTVIYVPIYNPWRVYGASIESYPGYRLAQSQQSDVEVHFSKAGVRLAAFESYSWSWKNWQFNWRKRTLMFDGARYFPAKRND